MWMRCSTECPSTATPFTRADGLMAHTYLKQSTAATAGHDAQVADAVSQMLAALRAGGEDEALALAKQFDGWEGPIGFDRDAMQAARTELDSALIDDIVEAHRNIEMFAQAQRDSLQPFEIEVSPGLRAGHR